MQQVARREHTGNMSWARALILATGLFFITTIFLGQIPGYIYTVTTLAKLTTFEQGFWSLGLLFIGLGLIGVTLVLLYDPKPVLPPIVFVGLGGLLSVVGLGVLVYVVFGNQIFFPSDAQSFSPILNGKFLWFQADALDLVSLGSVLLGTGVGVGIYGWFAPKAAKGELSGEKIQYIALVAGFIAGILVALYVLLYTFGTTIKQIPAPHIVYNSAITGIFQNQFNAGLFFNIILSIALLLGLVTVQLWFLPVLVADKRNYMSGAYLTAVNILGIGVVFLLAWVVAYPLVYWIHTLDSSQLFVSCSQKKLIPGSCTFTAYTGYIVAAIVSGGFFQLLLMGIYFWSTRKQAVIYTGVQLLIITAAGAVVTHTTGAGLPTSLFIGTAILLMTLTWVYAAKNEIGEVGNRNLGCVGHWLIAGTALLIYLAGFSFFSLIANNFFESESLGVLFDPGVHNDAFYALIITGIAAIVQFYYLMKNRYRA